MYVCFPVLALQHYVNNRYWCSKSTTQLLAMIIMTIISQELYVLCDIKIVHRARTRTKLLSFCTDVIYKQCRRWFQQY